MISVIIPTYNRNDLLTKCLDGLQPSVQIMPAVECEFIVTDDSKDNNAKRLIEEHYPWVTWVEGPKKGPAANRNNGVKSSKGEWLVFLDDDCLPQPGWINAYYEAIKQHSNILVFEGCTNAERPKQRFDEEAPINLSGDNLWSCNFAIRRDVFNSIDGFDETFPYAAMEDIDFHVRVKAVTAILFLPQAFIIHPWRRIQPFKSFKKHLKSHKHFAKKYNMQGTSAFRISRVKIFLGSLYYNFKSLASFSMRGWPAYLEKSLTDFCMIFI